MSIIFGILALFFGIGAFTFANPAGVPVFGLAFAAAGFLREFRNSKRVAVFILLGLATLICVFGTLRSFQLIPSFSKPSQTQTSSNPEFPITGAEVWNVRGTNYNIEGTSLLVMGNGQTLFVIKALCNFAPDVTHKPIAQSLAKYAVEHGYHKKVSASWRNGIAQPFSGVIGVALIQQSGSGILTLSSGYRYTFQVSELEGKTNR
jgi:hypothetical protein